MNIDADAIERARKLFAGPCDFVAGATTTGVFPPPDLPEIAFVGRSNVGKSSLVNALTGRKTLARVSQTPGRTRQVNFFKLADALMLVDLPGYGFAKVSKAQAAEWQQLIMDYLRGRPNLRRVILLVDARRGAMDTDLDAMKLLDQAAVSYLVVLTKIDTLKPAERSGAQKNVQAQLAGHAAAYPDILSTSADTAEGIDLLRAHIAALAEG
ncbi:MAG TPA: ribosome biogenesis GTP-binding protein YihA/YsxC [Rhizomicrobium sp.]|nr:ribosome biogenesis GTP-binding protein YihA/YsxC [Rhizomicrobium sp.]